MFLLQKPFPFYFKCPSLHVTRAVGIFCLLFFYCCSLNDAVIAKRHTADLTLIGRPDTCRRSTPIWRQWARHVKSGNTKLPQRHVERSWWCQTTKHPRKPFSWWFLTVGQALSQSKGDCACACRVRLLSVVGNLSWTLNVGCVSRDRHEKKKILRRTKPDTCWTMIGLVIFMNIMAFFEETKDSESILNFQP